MTPKMASFEVTLPLLFFLSWLSTLLPARSCWSCTFSWGKVWRGCAQLLACREGLLSCSRRLRVGGSVALLVSCSWVLWAQGALVCSNAQPAVCQHPLQPWCQGLLLQ